LRRLFEPLGYALSARGQALDERFPDWGPSAYFSIELSHTITLHELLTHLYVLVPVLDNDKHYWIGEDEVNKLLRHGSPLLAAHPEREQITYRYLKHRGHLARAALARLLEEDQKEAEQTEERHATEEEQVERKISLNEQRLSAVVAALSASGAKRVLDLGCSYGTCCGGCWRIVSSSRSSAWMFRRARFRSRPIVCTWTACPSGSASASS
jgi:3' terminal RNA ribose 2'-O-methyltransferase Hen1